MKTRIVCLGFLVLFSAVCCEGGEVLSKADVLPRPQAWFAGGCPAVNSIRFELPKVISLPAVPNQVLSFWMISPVTPLLVCRLAWATNDADQGLDDDPDDDALWPQQVEAGVQLAKWWSRRPNALAPDSFDNVNPRPPP